MAHAHRWPDLKIGIVSLTTVLVVGLAILVFGNVGAVHGRKFTLYVTTDAARGVIRGTEVWLDGQLVGTVKDVAFCPPTVNPKDRLVLVLSMLEDARPHIRMDTRVQIRAGTTIIGDQVVYMSSGTARQRGIRAGDTIRAGEQPDFESVSSDVALASREFPGIIENVKLLSAQLRSTEGVIGAFGVDMRGPQLQRLRARSERLMSRISGGSGTIPMLLGSSDELRGRASRAMAAADSIRTLLSSDRHSFGRFRRDSTLGRQIQETRDELERVQALASSPNGTIGRLRADSAITVAIHRDVASLDSLFADIKTHPLRYIAF